MFGLDLLGDCGRMFADEERLKKEEEENEDYN